MGLVGQGEESVGDVGGATDEDRGEPVGGEGFGLAAAGLVEGVRGCPDVSGDVDEVDQDVDRHAAAGGFGLDDLGLVTGAVDQDDPVTQVVRVARLGLVERLGGDFLGVLTREAVSDLFSAFGRGRRVRLVLRPSSGPITSCGRREAGRVSKTQAMVAIRFRLGFSPGANARAACNRAHRWHHTQPAGGSTTAPVLRAGIPE